MIEFSDLQLDQMQHCIGYEKDRVRGRKHLKYNAYRNRFVARCYLTHWDELVERGLAESERKTGCTYVLYWLTRAGMDALSEFLGVAITEED